MAPAVPLGIRAAAVAVLTVLALATASGTSAPDAGTSGDAGNTIGSALLLPSYGSYAARLVGDDTDWFAVADSSSAPRCVSAEVSVASSAASILSLDTPAGRKTTSLNAPSGGTTRLGLAVPSLSRANLGVDNGAGTQDYGFTLSSIGIPSASAGDALSGLDAGNTLQNALATAQSCVGGRISSLQASGDTSDFYSINGNAGDTITYTLATAAARGAVELRLLDAAGNLLGPVLLSGDMSTLTLGSAGTYFLSVSQGSLGTDDVGYVLGLAIGPPDPGSSCRPNC